MQYWTLKYSKFNQLILLPANLSCRQLCSECSLSLWNNYFLPNPIYSQKNEQTAINTDLKLRRQSSQCREGEREYRVRNFSDGASQHLLPLLSSMAGTRRMQGSRTEDARCGCPPLSLTHGISCLFKDFILGSSLENHEGIYHCTPSKCHVNISCPSKLNRCAVGIINVILYAGSFQKQPKWAHVHKPFTFSHHKTAIWDGAVWKQSRRKMAQQKTKALSP